jgi:hypothetical protein
LIWRNGCGAMERLKMKKLTFCKLAELISVPDFVTESINNTDAFITKHKKQNSYFNYSNPVKHFMTKRLKV